MNTLLAALNLSIIILAIYLAFDHQNILGGVRAFVANRLDKWVGKTRSVFIQKPLWECYPCMASVWTIIIYALNGDLLQRLCSDPFEFVLQILLVCGMNKIVESSIGLE